MYLLLDRPVTRTTWRIFTSAGEQVDGFAYGSNPKPAWTPKRSSGLYLIRITIEYANGVRLVKTFKGMVLK